MNFKETIFCGCSDNRMIQGGPLKHGAGFRDRSWIVSIFFKKFGASCK